MHEDGGRVYTYVCCDSRRTVTIPDSQFQTESLWMLGAWFRSHKKYGAQWLVMPFTSFCTRCVMSATFYCCLINSKLFCIIVYIVGSSLCWYYYWNTCALRDKYLREYLHLTCLRYVSSVLMIILTRVCANHCGRVSQGHSHFKSLRVLWEGQEPFGTFALASSGSW